MPKNAFEIWNLEIYNFHVRKGNSLQSNIVGRPCRITEEAEGKGNRRKMKASVNFPQSMKVNMKTRSAYVYSGCFSCTVTCEGNRLS